MGASIRMQQGGGGRRRRGRRHAAAMSEINVTPFVDVMLVLLIIFMVTAPMLTAGVPLDLPSAKGRDLPTPSTTPITVSVDKDGIIFIQEHKVAFEGLVDQLREMAKARGKSADDPVFVRGHKNVDWEKVIRVLAVLKTAGFSKVSLVTSPEVKG